MRPVLGSAQPWHLHHGFGDLCAACHAGDPGAADKELAHRGLRSPLADVQAACAGCHPDDAAVRAGRYFTASAVTRPAPPPAPSPAGPARATSPANAVLAGLALLLAATTAGLVAHDRHRLPALAPGAWLRARTWPPCVAGAGLGIVVAVAAVFCGRPLAASGAFDKIAAYAGRALFPRSQYYAHVMTPGFTWQGWLLVGLLLGSFASARLAGQARWRWLPDSQLVPRFGPRRAVRLALAFGGAVLVQLGAGIAGGCTSGLAISGGAVLAPAAFLFMAGMFAGGIPTAWLWYRGEGRR